MITLERFALYMAALGTVFSGPIGKEKVSIYYDYLKIFDEEKLKAAVDKIIVTRRRSDFPTIAEIVDEITGMDEVTTFGRGANAWKEACRSLRDDYPYERITCSLDIAESVKIAFGSWTSFGQRDEKNDSFDRQYFIKVYDSIIRKRASENILLGLHPGMKRLKEDKND